MDCLSYFTNMHEISTELLYQVLSPPLGRSWVALLELFSKELIEQRNEIEHTVINSHQKAFMILTKLCSLTISIPVSKLKTFIERELEILKNTL